MAIIITVIGRQICYTQNTKKTIDCCCCIIFDLPTKKYITYINSNRSKLVIDLNMDFWVNHTHTQQYRNYEQIVKIREWQIYQIRLFGSMEKIIIINFRKKIASCLMIFLMLNLQKFSFSNPNTYFCSCDSGWRQFFRWPSWSRGILNSFEFSGIHCMAIYCSGLDGAGADK